MNDGILDSIKDKICSEVTNFDDIKALLEGIEKLKGQVLNVLFAGATGAGKSSTINAIFNTDVARVGYSADPETSSIQQFKVDNITLWDSPGLGDSPENDQKYALEIANALMAKDDNGHMLIDAVVVLIDASNRDMGTAYEIIEKVVVPYIGDTKRIIVAINQCDSALKGRHWNYEKEQPDGQLTEFLKEKSVSVKNRIKESTGITVEPVYYSALYHYNISKLLLAMLRTIPEEKRFLVLDGLNSNPKVWEKNDELEIYNRKIQSEIKGSISKALDGAAKGALAGATVGGLIPFLGPVAGALAGAALGFLGEWLE